MALNTDTAPPAPAAPRSSHGAQAPSRPAMTATPTPDHPPLRAPITPYRLFNFLLLLSLRRPNAVFSPIGRSASAGDLDWAGALAAGVILYVLSGWAGVADLRWGRWFFRKDLSRPTFDFVQKNTSPLRVLQRVIVPALKVTWSATIFTGMVFWMTLEDALGTRVLLGAALAAIAVKAVLSATEYNRISISPVWRALNLSSWDEPWNAA